MKPAFFLLFLISANWALACEQKIKFNHLNKVIELCHTKDIDLYLSPVCESVETCFLSQKITFDTYPNQSPDFSLCYQLQGKPFFAQIPERKQKVPLCSLNGHYVDLENLMMAHRKLM